MSSQLAHVINFKNDSIYEKINIFLIDKGWNGLKISESSNTSLAYKKDIESFFMFVRNKKLEDLTVQDLFFDDLTDIDKYKIHIKSYSKSNNTLKRKFASLRSLYEYFSSRCRYDVDSTWFKLGKLKNTTNSYGFISKEEWETMIVEVQKQYKGFEKSMLITLAGITSLRLDALLRLEWDKHFIYNKKENLYYVDIFDKVDIAHRAIPVECYNELLKLKDENFPEEKRKFVFNLDPGTCAKMIKYLVRDLNIDNNRNIVFHSLRKLAPSYGINELRNIALAQQQSGHKDVNVLMTRYVQPNESRAKLPGIQMLQNIDLSKVEELSKDEIIKIINQCSEGVQREIALMADKI